MGAPILNMRRARFIVDIVLCGGGGGLGGVSEVAMAVGFWNICSVVGWILAEYAHQHRVAHPCHTPRAARGM